MTQRPDKKEAQNYPVTRDSLLLPFLLEHVRGKSRNNIKSLLSRGQVAVNGRTATRFDAPLSPGQAVTVSPYAAETPQLPFPIVYEDSELLAIDKPSGMLSVATDRKESVTAYRLLNDQYQSVAGRIFVVHRLDRDTSGVLLFSKNHALKLAFQENWNRLITKRGYLAVVEGRPQQDSGIIRSHLHETATHLVYSGSPQGGLEAITHYQVLDSKRGFSLLDIEIDTGRKNQIRVHMKELGHPIIGDRQYGSGSRSNPLGRLGLHAGELELMHPVSGIPMRFEAPMPVEFRRLFPIRKTR